jgi:hypothetical protein
MMEMQHGEEEPISLAYARWLREQGLTLIPLGAPGEEPPGWFVRQKGGDIQAAREEWPKAPMIKWGEYQTRDMTDEEFDAFARQFPGCNWGILTGKPGGIDVLDGDSPEAVQYIRDNMTWTPITVRTRDDGSRRHFWYRVGDIALRSTAKQKLDTKGVGGYVVAPGSRHPSGSTYMLEIADGFSDAVVLEAPELKMSDLEAVAKRNGKKAADYIFRPEGETVVPMPARGNNLDFDATTVDPNGLPPEPEARKAEIRGMLSFLDPDMDYDDWRDVGFALHYLNDPTLFEIYDDWSKLGSKYPGIARMRYTWSSFSGEKDRKVTFATLSYHARKAGWKGQALEKVEINKKSAIAKLVAIDAGNLRDREIKPVEWTWEGWFPKRYATGLFAEGGTGKSMLMLQLAVCRACGIPFIDGKIPPPGKTLLLFCEDDIEVANARLHKVMRKYGVSWDDIKGKVFILCRVGEDNYMMTFDQKDVGTLTPFFYQVRDLIAELGVDLIVLDTRNDIFAGNEIDNSQARQFVQRVVTALAQEFNASAVFLAHVSVMGKASGSGLSGGSAWRDTARSQVYMHREGSHSQKVTIELKKANHAQSGEEIEVWNDLGFLIPAASVDLSSQVEDQARVDFLSILERGRKNEQYYSAHKQGKDYAPMEFARIAKQVKKWKTLDMEAFEGAMEQLLESGAISRWSDPTGRIKHRLWRNGWNDTENDK